MIIHFDRRESTDSAKDLRLHLHTGRPATSTRTADVRFFRIALPVSRPTVPDAPRPPMAPRLIDTVGGVC